MIHYNFHISGLEVKALADLSPSSREFYLSRLPEATHAVISPGQVVYALADSQNEAEEARRRLLKVSAR